MRYVFVPFVAVPNDLARDAELIGEFVSWFGDTNQALTRLKRGHDELYVLGHCAAGSTTISTSHTAAVSVTAETVAERLKRSALPISFDRLTLLACEAGQPGRGDSFASQLRQALQKEGYHNITVVASNTSVSTPDFLGRTFNRPGNKRGAISQFTDGRRKKH